MSLKPRLDTALPPGNDGPCFDDLQVIDDLAPHPGPVNMALDEVLLAESSGRWPVLRFYRWTVPTVSFGYFEPAADARRLAAGRPVVRRMTGGGLVEHGDDVTYTLVVPRPTPFVNFRSTESYRLIHAAVASALAHGGLLVRSHPGNPAPGPAGDGNACFRQPVLHDLTTDGHKVAGGAQRRTRAGLLHQGSVRLGDAAPPGWADALRAALPAVLARQYAQRRFTADEIERARTLAAVRYAAAAWADRR